MTGSPLRRPYWITSVAFCLAGLPFVALKVRLLAARPCHPTNLGPAAPPALSRGSQRKLPAAQATVVTRPTRPAPLTLLTLSLAFSLLHVLTAAEVKRWAKRRQELGLGGYGFPWQARPPVAAQSARLGPHQGRLLGSSHTLGRARCTPREHLGPLLAHCWTRRGPAAPWCEPTCILQEGEVDASTGVGCFGRAARQQELPATALADPDSLFVSVGDTIVHFKEAWPGVRLLAHCLLGLHLPWLARCTGHSRPMHAWLCKGDGACRLILQQAVCTAQASAEQPSELGCPGWGRKRGVGRGAGARLCGWEPGLAPGHAGARGPLRQTRGGPGQAWRRQASPASAGREWGLPAFSVLGYMPVKAVMQPCAQWVQQGCAAGVASEAQAGPRLGPAGLTSVLPAGLTTRPAWSSSQGTPNPFDAAPQAQLLLAFCDALGIKTATLVGHSDGAVPVVLAAAVAARWPPQALLLSHVWTALAWLAPPAGSLAAEAGHAWGLQSVWQPAGAPACASDSAPWCRGDCSLLGQIGPIGRSRSASEAEVHAPAAAAVAARGLLHARLSVVLPAGPAQPAAARHPHAAVQQVRPSASLPRGQLAARPCAAVAALHLSSGGAPD